MTLDIRKLMLAAAVLCAQAAFALTSWHEDGVSGMTYLDGGPGNEEANFSGAAAAKLLVNASEADGETHVLFRAPAALFGTGAARLAKATATFKVTRARNWDGRGILLQPLAAPYDAASATWLSRAESTAWETAGGDLLDGPSVPGVYDAEAATVTFDLLPLLADGDAAAAFGANGALVRLDAEERPASGFVMLQLATEVNEDEALRPETFWVELDSWSDARDFAVSYIDSRDAATVYWEQGGSFVGKVILNGKDGSECRAILTMPGSLAELSPSRVQSVVATFDAEIQDWDGEDIFLAPLATATKLERHPNNDTSPVHGPSWNCADASTDPDASSYVIGGETVGNAPWKVPGGDWMADRAVRGTVTPPSGAGAGKAEFDLTALWHDDVARAALLANGAIVFLDPDAFDAAKDDQRMARVNLYRPDDVVVDLRNKHSWVRVTEYEALSGVPATTYIDSSAPDRNFSAANKTLVTLDNAASGHESRALVAFPPSLSGVDLHSAGSVNLLVSYFRSWPGDAGVNPVALHPAATAFRPDEATWNNATADTAWQTPGGDCLDAHVTAADSPSQSVLAFDLAPLLADAGAAAALAANGAVIRMLGDAPEAASNNGYNVNGSASASVPAIVLAPAGLAVRGIGTDPGTGALHFSVAGLDPLRTYVLESASDLASPDWTAEQTFPRSGELSVLPPTNAPAAFYRIRAAD